MKEALCLEVYLCMVKRRICLAKAGKLCLTTNDRAGTLVKRQRNFFTKVLQHSTITHLFHSHSVPPALHILLHVTLESTANTNTQARADLTTVQEVDCRSLPYASMIYPAPSYTAWPWLAPYI